MAHNVEAFVFVAEFGIRQLGTNADVKYKSSLLILLLNLYRRAGAEADSSTQLKRRYPSADITQMQCCRQFYSSGVSPGYMSIVLSVPNFKPNEIKNCLSFSIF